MPSPDSPSRELQLLLACARTALDAAAVQRVRTLAQQPLDWDAVLAGAEAHDVRPLLYRSLSTACPQAVPAATLASLKQWVHANGLRSLRLTRELARLLRTLGTAGVQALPIKGPLLAQMAYGDVALRYSVDLDIVLPHRDMQRALAALRNLGYALTEECARHRDAYEHVHNHVTLENSARTMVEAHWRLAPRHFSVHADGAGVWQRRVPVDLGGARLHAPCAADTLLLISVHGALHGWKQLKNVCDVAELVQRQPMDWDAVWQRAQAWGVERMVLLGLLLCRDLLQAPLPPAVEQRVASDRELPELRRMILPVLFGRRAAPADGEPRSFPAYYARLRERRRDRVEETLRRTCIPTMPEWNSLHLPRSLSFLHYLIRPLRLARRYALGARR